MTSSSSQSTTNQTTGQNYASQANQTGNTTSAANANGQTASQVNPWSTALPTVTSILSQLNPLVASSGLTSPQQTAINQLTQNAMAGNPYAPQIGNVATSLLNGGGATAQAPNIENYYQQYYNATNPLASNTNYDPMQTPGIGTQLAGLENSITSNINGQFAAGGRDGSGANSQALAYGLAQGLAPVLTNQYNTNVTNQQNAASNLYQNGLGSAALLSGLQQQGLTNQQNGITAANNALTANNYGPNALLTAQQYLQSIPTANLGALSGIAVPIAGLGSSSSGTTSQAQTGNNTTNLTGTQQGNATGTMNGVTNTTSTPSLLQDITGLGGLFSSGAGGTSGIQGMANFGGGLLSGLGSLLAL